MEEKKSKYSEAQNKATQKYIKSNLEEIKFRVRKGAKQYYKDAAELAGMSMAQFFITAAEEKIRRDSIYSDYEKSDISRFYGIVVKMFPKPEQPIVTIYAIHGEYSGVFDVCTIQMIEGDMEEQAQELVIDWIKDNQKELLNMWADNKVSILPPLE